MTCEMWTVHRREGGNKRWENKRRKKEKTRPDTGLNRHGWGAKWRSRGLADWPIPMSDAKRDVWGLVVQNKNMCPWGKNLCITFCISLEMPRIPGNCNSLWPMGWRFLQALSAAERKGGRGGWPGGGLGAQRHLLVTAWDVPRGTAPAARWHPVPLPPSWESLWGAAPHRVTCTRSFPPDQFWPRRICSEKNESGKGHGELRRKRPSRVQGWGKRGHGNRVAECVWGGGRKRS